MFDSDCGWFARLTSAGGDAATHLALTRAGIWGSGGGGVNGSAVAAATHVVVNDSSSSSSSSSTLRQKNIDAFFLSQMKRRCGELATRVGILVGVVQAELVRHIS